MGAEDRSLLLLTAFARALSHKIRTPLAVVANELSFLESTGAAGTGVASDRVREISALLKESTLPDLSALKLESLDLTPVAAMLGSVSGETFRIRSNKATIELAFSFINRIFSRHAPASTPVRLTAGSGVIILELDRKWERENPSPGAASESITEFLTVKLGLDSIEAPLVDAILQALGIKLNIALHDTLRLRLEIPRA